MLKLLPCRVACIYTSLYVHVGKPVMIVNGAYRGLRAVMERLNEESSSVTVKINQVHVHVEG